MITDLNKLLQYLIYMIRDTRRINIETNFFDDDNDLEFKPQQDTF